MVDEAVEAGPTHRRRLIAAAAAAAVLAGGLGIVGATNASAGQNGAGRGDGSKEARAGGHECNRQRDAGEVSV